MFLTLLLGTGTKKKNVFGSVPVDQNKLEWSKN